MRRWWHQLTVGDEQVILTVLESAFAENAAPVKLIHAQGAAAVLRAAAARAGRGS
jgi:hypothetical protein